MLGPPRRCAGLPRSFIEASFRRQPSLVQPAILPTFGIHKPSSSGVVYVQAFPGPGPKMLAMEDGHPPSAFPGM